MVTISPCQSKSQLKLFENIPTILFGKDPNFIPPFPGTIVKLIRNFNHDHGQVFPFIAYRDGQPIGRIAAIVNRSHNEYYKDKVGFFGFFDVIDDVAVGKELIDMARKTLRDHGLEIMRGPYNLTVNDECGLLVEGFDATPFVMMPYNPSYYVPLYEKLGLKGVRNLGAYYFSASTQPPERIQKIVDRVKRTSGLTLRNIDMKRLDEELKIVKHLYNETLNVNWGFVPITLEDVQHTAEDLKVIADPSLIMIAEKSGVPVGFSMALPNINEFLYRIKDASLPMKFLKFLWYVKTRRPKEARLAVLGVLPEFRNKGIGALFYYETFARGHQRYKGAELSWVDEDNQEMISGINVMGGKKYKSYRIYEANAIQ